MFGRRRRSRGPAEPSVHDPDDAAPQQQRPAGRSVAVWYGPRPARPRAGRITHLDPLIEELLLGAAAMAALGAVIAVAFWLLTGISPRPFVFLAEVVGLGWGIVLLALASPYHGR